jgi:hypothetical protein
MDAQAPINVTPAQHHLRIVPTEVIDPLGPDEQASFESKEDQDLQSGYERFNAMLEKRVRHAQSRGSDGTAAITDLISIATDRHLKYDDGLKLRAGLREDTIDTDKLIDALKRGSFAGVQKEIDAADSRTKNVYEKRAEEFQRGLVGRVNLAEVDLNPKERQTLERAIEDGRANPEAIDRLINTSAKEHLVDLISELEDEHQMDRKHGRGRSRKLEA